MNTELLDRLRNDEDSLVERKSEGVNRAELRRTLVAFANSVPDGRSAVLFIGVRDDGSIQGVKSPDALQKTVADICDHTCYPPIVFSTEVLQIEGQAVLAVVVPPNQNRPHFAGQAFVREGSRSVVASEGIFQELVTRRLSKAHEILKWRDQPVTVVVRGKKLGSTKRLGDTRYRGTAECLVVDCSPHCVRLRVLSTSQAVAEPLGNVTISHDEMRGRLMLIIDEK